MNATRDKTDFENGYQLEIMGSAMLKGKAPRRWNWQRFYDSFVPMVITPREMAIHVWRGYSFTPVWRDHRREENFVRAHHVALDFDTGDETSSLDYLMRDGTMAWQFASFAYSTPSSTPDAPRSRIVFVLDYPILDADEYRALYQALSWHVARDGSYSDPACQDPLRLYYGSPDCEIRTNWSVLGFPAAQWMINNYNAYHPKQVAGVPQYRDVKIIDGTPSQARQQRNLASIAATVAAAPDGDRNATLMRQARLAGGYIATGSLNEQDVIAELTAATRAWDVKERDWIDRAIRYGIEYGRGVPLRFYSAPPLSDVL